MDLEYVLGHDNSEKGRWNIKTASKIHQCTKRREGKGAHIPARPQPNTLPPSNLCLTLFPDTGTRMVPSRMLHVRPAVPSTTAVVSALEKGGGSWGGTTCCEGLHRGFNRVGPVGRQIRRVPCIEKVVAAWWARQVS